MSDNNDPAPPKPADPAGSSLPADGRCRALLGGQEHVFSSLEELAAAAGRLGLDARTRVSLPGRRGWVVAREVPELVAVLSDDDPWAAWDALDDVPSTTPTARAAAPVSRPPATPVPELDDVHVDPLALAEPVESGTDGRQRFVLDSSRGSRARRPGVSGSAGGEPAGSAPTAASGPSRSTGTPSEAPRSRRLPADARGKVIAFPTPPGAPVVGPHALAPLELEPMALPLVEVPPPPPPRSGARWGRLVAFAVVVFLFVGGLTAWVRHHAGQQFVPPTRPAAQARPAPAVAAVSAPPPVPAAAATDDLTRLEDELRARMRPRPQEVSAPGDLEDALYVEFSRMNLEDLRVEAQVVGWAGRKPPVPKVAEVVVRFTSRGELDRELAAVGLVMGKYVQAYSMKLTRLEAIVEGIDELPRRQSIDGEQARLFYVERRGLVDYLQGMRKGG